MKNIFDPYKQYLYIGGTLLGLFIIFFAMESWRQSKKPSPINSKQNIRQELAGVADKFVKQQQKILNQTQDIAESLEPLLIKNRPPKELYEHLPSSSNLWGMALYQQDQPIVWKGFPQFTPDNDIFEGSLDPKIVIQKKNNVIYWETRVPFNVDDGKTDTWYQLHATYRIEQSNPLYIGSGSEFNFFKSEVISGKYTIGFKLFSELSENTLFTEKLENLAGDSVGVVYASSMEETGQSPTQWFKKTSFWRLAFGIFASFILVLLFFNVVSKLKWNRALIVQLFLIVAGWLLFTYTNILSSWVLILTDLSTNLSKSTIHHLCKLIVHSTFIVLATLALAKKLPFFHRKLKATSFLSAIGIAVFAGLVNVWVLPNTIYLLDQYLTLEKIPLLDLSIIPAGSTVLSYISLGLALLALASLLITLNQFLLRTVRNHLKLATILLGLTFLIGLSFSSFFPFVPSLPTWILITSLVAFVIIFGFIIGYTGQAYWNSRVSPLRTLIFASIFIAAIGMPLIYQTYLKNLDTTLIFKARDFAQENDPHAKELTRDLLIKLENKFRSLNYNKLYNEQATLQTEFTQTIREFLEQKRSPYSFDLQMISATGEMLASYSTNLNSPNWVNTYSIDDLQLVINIQQITKSSIRPIVQKPQLVNQEDYKTFYRGWVPIFGISQQVPIAWVRSSVFKERPNFDKPIRAVMASLTYEDWNRPMLMQKYNHGKLTRTFKQGFAGYFPKYQQLNSRQRQILATDSISYYNFQDDQYTYRTLLWNSGKDQAISISALLVNYRTILFGFFRFSFTLLILGLLLLLVLQVLGWGRFALMGEDKLFQDRIIDSFLLATLIFMGFTIAASHYAIKHQNQNNVRLQLFNKLERLSNSIEKSSSRRNLLRLSRNSSLEALTTDLQADATFYNNLKVTKSTTPQIYRQHLLPEALPYNIYQKLYLQQNREAYSKVTIANQPLLIGYRSVLDANNEQIATIAIPTFPESPQYAQQLLEITSYLILAYLLVFGFFILGTVFISKSLTKPLVHIRHGLDKISGGDLNTTIPITSKDEIGNLAQAYNKMVFRLQELQKELAKAEREAAWKEMAQQVAHEIKNPLTPMKLNVQHLERQIQSGRYEGEELKERIQHITDNLIEQIQSLSNIASDFSKFSKPVSENFTALNLNNLLNSVKALYEHDRQVTVTLKLPDQELQVQGIADDLKRVFINIVKNAYEAMKDEGKISLTLYKQEEHAFIEIEDNGKGIAKSARNNIFVPNFSTKSGGTGLGLAICKKIVEAHDGSISFASIEGKGTTFIIKLPLNS